MPLNAMPAIDANMCSGWTEEQQNIYNSLPYFFAKSQVERRKRWLVWDKLIGKRSWTPNQGNTMRAVRTELAPRMRQFAFPNEICAQPKKDVYDLREVARDATVRSQAFESPILYFCPDFIDFMQHTNDNVKNISEQMEIFEDVFYRGNIFHQSPYVWLPNKASGELVSAPMGNGNQSGTDAKSRAWLAANIPLIGNPGNLSLSSINTLVTVAETDLRIPPFKDGGLPQDDVGLNDKFVLVLSTEAYNQLTFDPYLQANKNCDLDVVNKSFKGSLFGRVTCKLEDFPLRMSADGSFSQPEIREEGPTAYNKGENILDTDYANAPIEVAFLVGAQGYEAINVGPPPKAFASSGMPDGFGKMIWNGEIFFNKNLIIPCIQDDGSITYDTNSYGRYGRFQALATYGILSKQPRNIIPILFKRMRGTYVYLNNL